MRLDLKDIENSHEGKIAICTGMGPSLKKNLEDIVKKSHEEKDKYVFVCPNLYHRMTDINADFWVVANSVPEMQVEHLYKAINELQGVFIYSDEIDKTKVEELFKPETKYVPMNSCEKTIQQMVAEKCGFEELPYTDVNSVIVHLVAIAILTGASEICITGCDLKYTDGNEYVKNGVNRFGEGFGKLIKKEVFDDVIKDIQKLKEYAANINVEVYCMDDDTKLSRELGIKNI